MIYLIRHGLDDERFIGGHSNASLTAKGIEQVKQATDFITENKLKINRIYTSDIKRAIETTEIINSKLKVEIIKAKYLRELDKGELTGKKKTHNYKEVEEINKRYPNGESMLDLYKRIKTNLPKILQENNSLIVTHRGVINMIYYLLNNEEITLDKEKWNVTHASIHEYNPQLRLIKRIH